MADGVCLQRLHPNPIARLHLALCRSLCRQALQEGPVPHHRASDQLAHDERPQQRKEAHGRAHRRPHLRDCTSAPPTREYNAGSQLITPNNQIHIMTDQNPIQVAVDAIVNCGPREDSTRIGSAGTVRRQAVDVSPLRRVNQAIALLTIGAREASFRNVKSIAECLAEELINAAKGSSNSYAIKKKDELERVAKSNR